MVGREKMRVNNQLYALYKGDTFIDVGTIDEISERQKIKKKRLFTLKVPAYANRENRKENTFILVRLDDEE